MPVTSVDKNPDAMTLTITSDFPAPVERVWKLWEDPRQLERWWGPPTWPATFVDYDFSVGGDVSYYMTGPDGGRSHGWWRVLAIDAPSRLEFEDGFADDTGSPNPDMPTTITQVVLTATSTGTRMAILTTFPSREAMDQTLAMGVVEGMSLALGQIDDILAAEAASS